MRKKVFKMVFVCILFLPLVGCSIHPKIKSDQTYYRIKPIAPLPEYDQSALPENLEIIINNVADMDNSYKNYLKLYINKYLIESEEIYNYKSKYHYRVKLQPGVYKVKADYYAHSGWSEQRFPIEPKENIKVYLDKRAILEVTLQKNWWGAPRDKETYFKIRYEPLP